MNFKFTNQRDIFKFVENLTTGRHRSEITLLKSLVKQIVDHSEFEINGGRIWELNPAERTYVLKYQYGEVARIPSGYSIPISDNPTFDKLVKERIVLQEETDTLLRKKGIEVYSAVGVGDIIRVKSSNYFKYTLSFNAPQILQSFFEMLAIISSVATAALRNLTSKQAQKKIQHDLAQASDIQRNLLPEHYMEFKDYKIFGVCTPDAEVGGDYFDYLKSNEQEEEENLAIVVSDAASKGLPAATQALFVSGAIRMARGFSPKISQILSHLNRLIFETFPYERFVTLFYCELTATSNRLVLYGNAGHCAPIHYRPDNDSFKQLETTGGLLGIMHQQKFNVENIRMHPGDILLIYTDGITEAHDKDNNIYGEDRLYEIIRQHHTDDPEKLAYRILQDVQTFSTGSFYNDDRTLVVVKRDPA